MDQLDLRDTAPSADGGPYPDQWSLMTELMSLLDYRIYLLYKYHQWLGPENDMKNMLGLVVTREEFVHNLTRAARAPLSQRATAEETEQLVLGERAVLLRMERDDGAKLPLLRLFRRFGLDEFQRWCVILAYAACVDDKYEKLFAYLQDDITRKQPTTALCAALFMPAGGEYEKLMTQFGRESVFTSLFDREGLRRGVLLLRDAVLACLNGDVSLPTGYTLFDGLRDAPENELLIQQDVAATLDLLFDAPGPSAQLLVGAEGSGRGFQLAQLCARRGVRCLTADLAAAEDKAAAVSTGAMLARLTDAYLCLRGLEEESGSEGHATVGPPVLDAISRLRLHHDKLFLITTRPLHAELGLPAPELELAATTTAQRLTLFRAFLGKVPLAPDVSPEELAAKFHFTPRQIRRACVQAAGEAGLRGEALTAAALHRCCYRQVTHKLDALASRVRGGHDWDDVVLPPEQKRLLRQACAHVRYQHRVYYEWGFDKKISYGRGVSVLFAGVPGTGKTMCAQIMARQLNMEMYKINISQIVSKYIGETEKNLQAVFNEARNSNCILFFDECDALFGKRSEVKDAHDRNANVETAYLLQQIEEYDGVCVLATNLIQNIDEAFMRRMTFVVHFPFPNAEMRREIYLRTLPEGAPLDDDVDFTFLAEKFALSGGYIKNIVVSAAFMAAAAEKPMGMRHFLNAAINEMKKNEIVVVREELREYADLID